METDCHVVYVGEDGSFGTFAEDEGRGESYFFAEAEGRIVFAQDTEYSVQQLKCQHMDKIPYEKFGMNVPPRMYNRDHFSAKLLPRPQD